MPQYTAEQLESWRERDEIAWRVAQSTPKARRAGSDSVRIPCPVHGGKDPNCHVTRKADRLVATCFSRNCASSEIVETLAQAGGWTPPARKAGTGRTGRKMRGRPEPPKAVESSSPRPEPEPDVSEKAAARLKTDLVAGLWNSTIRPERTPGRLYLARRVAWPPDGTGPDLPESVGWIPADAAPPGPVRPAGWYGLPPGAAGALAFAWRDLAGTLTAVSLEALTATGEKIPTRRENRWRKTFGSRKGALFAARAGQAGDLAHVAEGEVSALALTFLEPDGRIFATDGTSGLKRLPEISGSLTVHVDGDPAGRMAAQESFLVSGSTWQLELYGLDTDPADELAAAVLERTAIREFDGEEPHSRAGRAAWLDIINRRKKGSILCIGNRKNL